MEDTGVAAALAALARAGRARGPGEGLLVLRTASNFVEPPPGEPAAAFMFRGGGQELTEPAFEAAYKVGAPVVLALAASARQHVPAAEVHWF
mmetsp:Transcript_14138/g.42556  ORF Transcript_14138/g.42556 Transcript_14138/m.42556 type:complete len:92 (+) Transcript_14138:2-277(+)